MATMDEVWSVPHLLGMFGNVLWVSLWR